MSDVFEGLAIARQWVDDNPNSTSITQELRNGKLEITLHCYDYTGQSHHVRMPHETISPSSIRRSIKLIQDMAITNVLATGGP